MKRKFWVLALAASVLSVVNCGEDSAATEPAASEEPSASEVSSGEILADEGATVENSPLADSTTILQTDAPEVSAVSSSSEGVPETLLVNPEPSPSEIVQELSSSDLSLESGSSGRQLESSSSEQLIESSSAQVTYAYGWALKNAPVPSRGCGKTWNRVKSGSYDFQWSKGSRTIRIDIPDDYDNSKPYRLIFGMHCMGGWAGGVQQEGYYGLKPLDVEHTSIFVAPEGNGNTAPWAEDDYTLFDELLADLEGNLCIDSSRVFSAGFSYGSMFTNGLSWNHQDVLRGVAVYETAERNIWLPEHTGKGIGWMGVLGFDDGLCTPEMGRNARDIILSHNSENGIAKNESAVEATPGGAHYCYNYTTTEERFPVRWCTQSGGHIWDHKDPGASTSWVPEATWDFINQF